MVHTGSTPTHRAIDIRHGLLHRDIGTQVRL
jgi:hypothetical protein